MQRQFLFFRISGFINVIVGFLAVLFAITGDFIFPGIKMYSVFSKSFFAFVALPCVIAASGVTIIIRMKINRMLSVFVSCISALYLGSVLFTNVPPGFIPNSDNICLVMSFKYIIPTLGVCFFALQGIISYFIQKKYIEPEDA